MKTESDSIHEYLKVTQIIDWDNRNVLAKAREIVKGIGEGRHIILPFIRIATANGAAHVRSANPMV